MTEIVDLLLQAKRSPRIWRWLEGLDEGSISSYEQVYSVGFLHVTPHLALSPQVSISGYMLSTYSCGIRILSAMDYGVRPFLM